MEKVNEVLEQELMELERIKKAAEEDLKDAPRGALRITKCNNIEQYYWRTDPKDTSGRYIKKSEQELIQKLAQKDYAQKVAAIVDSIIGIAKKEAEKLQKIDVYNQVLDVYEKLSPARKNLIVPYICTNEEFAVRWEAKMKMRKEKSEKTLSEEKLEIYTEKGELVRSKSEKILADKLYMMNIPYVYEVPLCLRGYGYIRPDFTVLNKRTRREYYWEHLGMMDEEKYCEKAIRKIESFEKNRIFPGKNLLLTYETKNHPLDIKVVEMLVKEYLF